MDEIKREQIKKNKILAEISYVINLNMNRENRDEKLTNYNCCVLLSLLL